MRAWLGMLPLLLLLGIACSSVTREPTGGVQPDTGAAGSSGAPNAAGGHPGASAGQAGEPATVTCGHAGAGGQASEVAGAAGAAGSPEVADAGPTWPDCAGTWAICDGPDADGKPLGYGYACQYSSGQGACEVYCDTDSIWGTIEPWKQARCEAAGGQCSCLGLGTLDDAGNVDDSGPCSNRYQCQPRAAVP